MPYRSADRIWGIRMAALIVMCLIGALLGTDARQLLARQPSRTGDRRVWQYAGGYGPSWFVHEGGKKWVIYRGDGRTFLYVEEKRTDEYIEIRGPYTKLLIRLSADKFETRRSVDQPWRRSAGGRWVRESNLPEKIRQAPKGYQIRLVYFVPSDREPVPKYEPKIRLIMSIVSGLIHNDLQSKGYRSKRLEFESLDGEMVVRLVRGVKPASYYHADWQTNSQAQVTRIHAEILTSVGDPDRHVTIVFAETYHDGPVKEAWAGHVARGVAKPPEGGFAVYSSWILKDDFTAANQETQLKLFFDRTPIRGRKAFGSRLPNSPRYEFIEDAFGAVVHELGHALGLPHDYRNPSRNFMGIGFRELRWNLDPRSPPSRKVGFSVDNARMLMSSRYLARDLKLEDFDPPRVEFGLKRRGRTLTASVRAEDETGLRALLFYDRTKKVASLVGGKQLRGRKQEIIQRLPADLLAPGLEPKVEVFVSDEGGNVTRVTRSLVATSR